MARRLKSKTLDTRTARLSLKVRPKPYYAKVTNGCHLGYRRLRGGDGTWCARLYAGDGAYVVKSLNAAADDHSDADGRTILTYDQAVDAARALARKERAKRDGDDHAQHDGPYTVNDAIDDYLAETKSATAKNHARAFIRPKLGKIELKALSKKRLKAWLEDLAETAPRLRSKKGEAPRFAAFDPEDKEQVRARQATANRVWTTLRRALNFAFEEKKVESDFEWRRVKPFKNVNEAEARSLSADEALRLVNAADADFRPLVEAALVTGARYGALIGMRVSAFNPDKKTVHIPAVLSKSGKPYTVPLTDEGAEFFGRVTAGKPSSSLIFVKADGTAWKETHQTRPMRDACQRARIEPPMKFHGLRHTFAQLNINRGVPLQAVAAALGHKDTRMCERHYAKPKDDFVAKAIRKDGGVTFGLDAGNVLPIANAR